MARRQQPLDPEALASVIMAFRRIVDGGVPNNDFEREFLQALEHARLDPAVIARMVRNFDRITPGVRRRALGPFGDSSFVPRLRRERIPDTVSPRRPRPWSIIVPPRLVVEPGVPAPRGEFLGDTAPSDRRHSYGIKYVGFHCDRERGDAGDFIVSTSDEVYLITSAVHIDTDNNNLVRTEKHPVDRLEYEDVDTGETRLGPIAACWAGGFDLLPVSFTVVAYERDHGNPDHYKEEIHAAVQAVLAALSIWYPGARLLLLADALSGGITDLINWLAGTGDDQVDIPRTRVLTPQLIERLGRQGRRRHIHRGQRVVGSGLTPRFEEVEIATDLVAHFYSKHSGGGGQYVFGFDLERNPPFVEVPTPVD